MGIAVGAALTQQMQNTGKIVVCFFGDGATNEGVFHEAVNMASIWNLPVFSIVLITVMESLLISKNDQCRAYSRA